MMSSTMSSTNPKSALLIVPPSSNNDGLPLPQFVELVLPSIPLSDLLFLSNSSMSSIFPITEGRSDDDDEHDVRDDTDTDTIDTDTVDTETVHKPCHASFSEPDTTQQVQQQQEEEEEEDTTTANPYPAALTSYLKSADATLFGLIGHHADTKSLETVRVKSSGAGKRTLAPLP